MAKRKTPTARLKEILGISYNELADRLGMSADHVRHLGAGLCGPMRPRFARRASELARGRISAGEFVFGELRSRRRRAS